MNDKLEVCEFDDLTTHEKSVAIVRLYINDVLQGEGTMKEIAEKMNRRVASLYVGLSRTKSGEATIKKYRVELVEWVRFPVKEYELIREDTITGEIETLTIGSVKEIHKTTGICESYLRRLSSERCLESMEKIKEGKYKKRYQLSMVEIEDMEE